MIMQCDERGGDSGEGDRIDSRVDGAANASRRSDHTIMVDIEDSIVAVAVFSGREEHVGLGVLYYAALLSAICACPSSFPHCKCKCKLDELSFRSFISQGCVGK